VIKSLSGALLALVLSLSACTVGGSGEETEPAASPAPTVSNPLGECARNTKIGVIYDEAQQAAFAEGVTLAADQLNSRGSFNYEPVLKDGAADPDLATAAADEFAEDEEISAMVSTSRADTVRGAAAAARESGVASLLAGVSPDEFETGDGVFSLRLSEEAEIDGIADAAKASFGFHRLKVLRNADALLDPKEGYVLAPEDGVDPGELASAVAEKVDAANLFGTSIYAFGDLASLPRGMHVGVPWYVDAPEAVSQDFVELFEQDNGEKPTIDAAYGYTSVLLIARAVETACSNERTALTEELAKTREAASVFGRFSFDKNGEPHHQMFLIKIKP
jgi:ABC-type branched-subunit amino acid transport system substrate-binding protein